MGLLALAAVSLALAPAPSPTRPARQSERVKIARAVRSMWRYESRQLRGGRPLPRWHPAVVRARVARSDPRFSAAVVELHDARGRSVGPVGIVAFDGRYPVTDAGQSFPGVCASSVEPPIRALLCPDLWRVLRYPRPAVRPQTHLIQPIASPDLHRVAWRSVALPGGVCGSSRPIVLRDGAAFIQPDVDELWWNPVAVYADRKPVFGDLDGDGRDEAALDIGCANGGGTAAGQIAFDSVVFKAVGSSLRVVGIVRARQPLSTDPAHVPIIGVRSISRGRVAVSEYWYGPYDSDCCSTGRARTTWRYARGRLRPERTMIVEPPRTSGLAVIEVLVQPDDRDLYEERTSRITLRPALHFVVKVINEGDTPARDVKLRMTAGSWSQEQTIDRIGSSDFGGRAARFAPDAAAVPVGARTTLRVVIEAPGTAPERYPVIFRRP